MPGEGEANNAGDGSGSGSGSGSGAKKPRILILDEVSADPLAETTLAEIDVDTPLGAPPSQGVTPVSGHGGDGASTAAATAGGPIATGGGGGGGGGGTDGDGDVMVFSDAVFADFKPEDVFHFSDARFSDFAPSDVISLDDGDDGPDGKGGNAFVGSLDELTTALRDEQSTTAKLRARVTRLEQVSGFRIVARWVNMRCIDPCF